MQHLSSLSYGGRCARCGGKSTTIHHALRATPEAVAAADALRQSLERYRRLDFDAPDPSSSCSDAYSTLPFLPRRAGGNGGPGRMLGVLLCADGTVLRAFSGQLALSSSSSGEGGGGWDCPGWAGPVAGITNASPEYGRFRALSDRLTRRIERAGDEGGENRQKLRARRRALSHALIARVQDSYVTRDLLGRTVRLREAYLALGEAAAAAEEAAEGAEPPPLPIARLSPGCGGGGPLQATNDEAFLGFPAGTGDCCAPKLLHEAALRGLKPVGLAEFWFGAPPDGDGGGDDGNGACFSAPSSSTESEGEEVKESANISDKEAAWRRRQRRRVIKAQGRRRRAATAAPPRAHGEFCGPCFKCMGILGTMLCSCVE
jgi:tRNA pseudouridine32 synthase/23S rRNA pseudouridine746 synthase